MKLSANERGRLQPIPLIHRLEDHESVLAIQRSRRSRTAEKSERVFNKDRMQLARIADMKIERVELFASLRNTRRVEHRDVRPVGAPDRAVGRRLTERANERRGVVVRRWALAHAVSA